LTVQTLLSVVVTESAAAGTGLPVESKVARGVKSETMTCEPLDSTTLLGTSCSGSPMETLTTAVLEPPPPPPLPSSLLFPQAARPTVEILHSATQSASLRRNMGTSSFSAFRSVTAVRGDSCAAPPRRAEKYAFSVQAP